MDKKGRGRSAQSDSDNQMGQIVPFKSGSIANQLAEHYKVSSKTINRNSKMAEALGKIGEASPDALKKILSEEVPINLTKLQSLHSASSEDITKLAHDIDSGAYDRKQLRAEAKAQAQERADRIAAAILPEIRELNHIISGFAKSFDNMLSEISAGDSAHLKPVIRSFIDQLEDLYKTI